VLDLDWLDARAVRAFEPAVRAAAALHCPSTGIVDAHELMTALHGDIESAGGAVVLDTEFIGGSATADGTRLRLRSGSASTQIECQWLVNSAGLTAVDVLGRLEAYPSARIPKSYYAKGNYFEFRGRSPFRRLVYPMPNEAGLRIHATLDLRGTLRFGPDVQWVAAIDYEVHATRAQSFCRSIRHYWPALPDGSLVPAYAGIRPKLVGPGENAADFRIETPADHGVAGLINLLGIESPGLTSSLAIGEWVAGQIRGPSQPCEPAGKMRSRQEPSLRRAIESPDRSGPSGRPASCQSTSNALA
jgi:L-2-hydroxyglutarate oxidase LhgO